MIFWALLIFMCLVNIVVIWCRLSTCAGQTANSLLRRLDNGALPQDNHTKVAVVWIGTNDLQTDVADKVGPAVTSAVAVGL